MRQFRSRSRVPGVLAPAALAFLTGLSSALFGVCGPFTDVAADSFCPFVLEIFTLGITTGTSPTTYDPSSAVTRLQMAAFLSRTVDRALQRGSRRSALDQFWTPQNETVLKLTTIGSFAQLIRSDGLDVWVANSSSNSVSRIRGSDGRLLETWTGATSASAPLMAMGSVFVTGFTSPGSLYRIDPSQPAGAVTTVASNLGNGSAGLTFDGSRIWAANVLGGSVSIITPGATIPWTVTTVAGFSVPITTLFDGANVWMTDGNAGTLRKLDSSGAILQTVTVGGSPVHAAFDGTNIWVPDRNSNAVAVVRASSGAVLSTLTGNGLDSPRVAAFDGQRVLVTNFNGNSASLWKRLHTSSTPGYIERKGPHV